jgi:hypothetical protein
MKLAVAASLVATAAAFAPAGQKSSASSSIKAFENDIGATLPLGFFDPLGLVADGDQAKFDRLRQVFSQIEAFWSVGSRRDGRAKIARKNGALLNIEAAPRRGCRVVSGLWLYLHL